VTAAVAPMHKAPMRSLEPKPAATVLKTIVPEPAVAPAVDVTAIVVAVEACQMDAVVPAAATADAMVVDFLIAMSLFSFS